MFNQEKTNLQASVASYNASNLEREIAALKRQIEEKEETLHSLSLSVIASFKAISILTNSETNGVETEALVRDIHNRPQIFRGILFTAMQANNIEVEDAPRVRSDALQVDP